MSGRSSLARLNEAEREQAEADLLACCGSRSWARRMAAERPFAAAAALHAAAERIWSELGAEDWLEAFRAHPRIGERKAATNAGPQVSGSAEARSARWSEGEQSGARDADLALLDELTAANRAYEERFGHLFIVCATGRSAAEMLALLRERLHNDPAAELPVAAAEQSKITRLRLEKLLTE